MVTLDDQNFKSENLLNTHAVKYLETTAKWANFLAIIGFIGIGIMFFFSLIMFFTGTFYSSMVVERGMNSGSLSLFGSFVPFLYLAFTILYVFPVLYMYRFAKKIKEAVYSAEPLTYEEGFENLKSFFKFSGILTIVIISMYLLMIPIAVISTMM